MADCAIILYLECLIGLIYHFKKLGQRDLNKKKYIIKVPSGTVVVTHLFVKKY